LRTRQDGYPQSYYAAFQANANAYTRMRPVRRLWCGVDRQPIAGQTQRVRTRRNSWQRFRSLCSIRTNQAAIIALFRVMNRYVGNLTAQSEVK